MQKQITPQQQELNDKLLFAIFNSDAKAVQELIVKGANVHVETQDGISGLSIAIATGATDIAKMLIQAPQQKHDREKMYQEALLTAASYGNKELLTYLIEKKVDVNHKGSDGETALMNAVSESRLETAQWLIEQGADVNAKDEWGRTPLLMASRATGEMVDLLLANGTDVDARDVDGFSPLFELVYKDDLPRVQKLVDKGADAKVLNQEGYSLLDYISSDNVPMARYLLSQGLDVNQKGVYKRTPLFRAVDSNYLNLTKFYLENGADVNAIDQYGQTPLFLTQDTKLMKLLLEKGAQPNHQNNVGRTVLFKYPFNMEVIDLLIEHKIDVNIPDKDGNTALLYMIEHGYYKAALKLLEKGANPTVKNKKGETALDLMAKKEYPEYQELRALLVQKGVKITASPKELKQKLEIAFYRKDVDAMRFYIDMGADFNAVQNQTSMLDRLYGYMTNDVKDKDMATYQEMEKLLLSRGAKTAVPIDERFASAVIRGDINDMKFFHARGAGIQTTYANSDMLNWATSLGHKEAVQWLLEKGADVNKKGYMGTPLDAISRMIENAKTEEELKKYQEIEKILLSHGAKKQAQQSTGMQSLKKASTAQKTTTATGMQTIKNASRGTPTQNHPSKKTSTR